MTVSVTGTSIISTVGNDGSFTLTAVPPGLVELHFSGGGVDARGTLSVVDHEQVTVTVTITGGSAQFNVQTAEAEGTISGLTGACPAITFSVGAFLVSTDANTTFSDGACQQLANGGKAEVKGVKQADGSIKATKVEMENAPPPAQPPVNPVAELEGTIGGLTGVCPVVSFTIGTTKVSTDLTTKFSDGTCVQLANGKKAEVKGSPLADGSIKATSVESSGGGDDNGGGDDQGGGGDDGDHHSGGAEVDGRLSGLTGLCPVISFTVGATKVTTDQTTSFSGGSCQKLTNGKPVEVTGTKQTDGSIKASKVNLDD
jgi:hypothetical protein